MFDYPKFKMTFKKPHLNHNGVVMIANFILLTYSRCFVNVPQVSFDHSQLSFEILHLDRLSKQTQLEAFFAVLKH